MIKKKLFIHTTTLFRAVLLLGTLAFVTPQQTQAQNSGQQAAMPDAFETMNPATVIGDGNYYYIQFYFGSDISYLSDQGAGNNLRTKDYIPFAKNLQWTLVSTGTDNQFKLKSLNGVWAYLDGTYKGTNDENTASTLTFYSHSGGGYDIGTTANPANAMAGNDNKGPWVDVYNNPKGNARCRLRVAKLKDNVAHIIYWQEPIYKDGNVVDRNTNTRGGAEGFTTHHYLTYSGTGTNNVISDDVSSRRSVLWYYDAWQLPTAAAYHQDGLWTLESAGTNGEFYIRKYGTEEYLNYDGSNSSVLGPKNPNYGKYVLESPNVNRFTRIHKETVSLTRDMFHLWSGVDANATPNSGTPNDVEYHIGDNNSLVAGPGSVWYLTYADLTGSTKMLIEGTAGSTIRVLLNRLAPGNQTNANGYNNANDSNGGSILDKRCTIGDNGRFELDLSDLPYVHLNAIKVLSGTATITSVKFVKERYLSCSNTDGVAVTQMTGNTATDWYAGFLPVEVPVPNKDEFYQVLVKWGANMINHNGGVSALPANEADYDLWQLEQIDDYGHFRLKAPNGRYLKPNGAGMTEPNNPEGAEIMDNAKFFLDGDRDFALTWYYVNPAQKEIPVDYYVTHRESYLKQYAEEYASLHLDRQGLTTDADSEWKNWNGNLGGFTQKVNHFEITHYIKRNDTKVIDFPTVLNKSNDHIYFQRFYNYDEVDTEMDLENLKAHVSLDDRDDGSVQYFLYKNGMVTGQKLDWHWDDGTAIPDGGYARNEQRRFNFTNSDGKPFTVAVDVSRYSDMTYANSTNHLDGDLQEPSLTMRYIYYMKDAKEMAAKLTACTEGSNKWLETKVFHFPAKQIAYEKKKEVGYRGEFLGLRHVFSDYWVFDTSNSVDEYNAGIDNENVDLTYLNEHLVSAVNDNNGGKIEVVIDDPNNTGIRLGGWNPTLAAAHGGTLKFVDDVDTYDAETEADFKGFYFYDKMSGHNDNVGKTQYGDSRFVVFRYPASGVVTNTGQEAYVNVYLNNNGTRYQLAQYTIIFDENSETLPWISNDASKTYPADGFVKGSARDPQQLLKKAGRPIAKVTFDYPDNSKYYFPEGVESIQGWRTGGSIDGCSPIPLTFAKTNYSFSGFECNWGSYAMVSSMTTNYGNKQNASPADDNTHGYGDASDQRLQADKGFQKSFLYIDASEQPGDICSAPFVGDFCANDKLMVSGWISGSNKMGGGDHRCPGGITMTIKGEHMVDGEPKTEILYRFCPGQCYELDDGPNAPDGSGLDGEEWLKNSNGQYVDSNGNVVTEEDRVKNPNYDNYKYNVIWQQFYFEFTVTEKYDRHWIEVNNNCVSSQGGDFMLDNVEVYAIVPEVQPDMNTPYCLEQDGKVDMRLLKLTVDFDKQKAYSNVSENAAADLGFVFLKKDVFLQTFKENLGATGLANYDLAEDITLDELAEAINEGVFRNIEGSNTAYQAAFNAALLGDPAIWKSTASSTNIGAGVMYFQWNSNYESMEEYSFAKAVNKTNSTYRYTDEEGERYIVMNGNYPQLPWQPNIDYYIVPSNEVVNSFNGEVYSAFNILSDCSKASVFKIDPPYTLLGLGASDEANDYMVCEGQIPTLVSDLKGYDFNGVEVPMNDINYDWWLGDKANGVLPTLENYHAQKKGGVRLDVALSTLRIYYPAVTSLDGIVGHAAVSPHPALTLDMVNYLRELVDAGQLILHQKSISVPAEPASADDPYFYLVACPIHDEQYDQALNYSGTISLVENGTMESYDASNFVTRYNNVNSEATISNGIGVDNSRGISVTSHINTVGEDIGQAWNTQFFIRANEVIPVGKKLHVAFDYKASATASGVQTQAHSEPSNYLVHGFLGEINFTTEWQHFEKDIDVTTANAGSGNNFQAIAFNLYLGTENEGVTYYFDNIVLTVGGNHYIAFFCDEPQGLRVKVGEKAPTLKTGFVSGENGFDSYDYTGAGDAILSIRLAKREQFETVKHGEPNTATIDTPTTENAETTHFLWLPLRNASVQSEGSDKVIQKSEDENIYLASTNDPVWDKQIYKSMKEGSLPIVGKIVQLNAIDVSKGGNENDNNRLCVYFTNNFDVREGYSYTLSLPFQESPGANTCDGTILINLKIVPDYEVWTGAAGNTDWNNDENWRRADGNLGKSVEEPKNGAGRNNNELYRTDDLPTTSPLRDYVTNYTNYRTPKDRIFRKGFAPLYCTHVLIKSNEWGDAPVLYDALAGKRALDAAPFPNLRDKDGWDGTTGEGATKATSTTILRYDMQARLYDIWSDTYGTTPNKGRPGDLIAEMYQINSCDEIAFQPTAEMLNAHLLNYNNAWVEYQLDNRRWYLLGSPLQGTISGEWYAPTGTAQQKTTYYEPVTFGEGYDRYSPAIYQRSWDKAKAVLYEVGSEYATTDNPNDLELVDGQLPGSYSEGLWSGTGAAANWQIPTAADKYLDRLGYKPLGGHKANVAMKGIWSNTYNDATVDYTKGGFSVMVMNHLKKDNDTSGGKSIIRLPKEDTMYDYYKFEETGANDGGTDTYLSDPNGQDKDDVQTNLNRAKNRGRLKTDLLLPTIGEGLEPYQKIQRTETTASRYGDARTYTRVPTRVGENALPMTLQPFTETVSAGISNMGYYLVENPFPCGLDMEKFFAKNTGLEKKYWILTSNGQQLVQLVPSGQWISPSDGAVTVTENEQSVTRYPNGKVAPGQGFFVQATTPGEATTITFTTDMQAQTRYGEPDAGEEYEIVVGSKQVMESVQAVDEEGNGLVDENNQPILVEKPKVDEDGNYVLEDIKEKVTVYKYKQKTGDGYQFPLKARRTRGTDLSPFIITAKRGDMQSSALVMERESASDDFLPEEDTEVFINSDLKNVPTVYTLCGRLATTINSIRDFRCLPLGVESASDAPCVLTFQGVEALGDSVAFYDAVEQKLTPLESGMQFSVSGQTQNRYYLVRTLNMEEAKEETHLLIFTEGLTARVIASTEEPVTSVRCFDTAGRLVLTASPQTADFSFSLPAAGVYVIEAHTEKDHKTRKVMVR